MTTHKFIGNCHSKFSRLEAIIKQVLIAMKNTHSVFIYTYKMFICTYILTYYQITNLQITAMVNINLILVRTPGKN